MGINPNNLTGLAVNISGEANSVLHGLARVQNTTRQVVIQPVIEGYAKAMAPVAIATCEAIIETLNTDEEPQEDPFVALAIFRGYHNQLISPEYPSKTVERQLRTQQIGLRVSASALQIFRLLTIGGDESSVAPQIEPIIEGYTDRSRASINLRI